MSRGQPPTAAHRTSRSWRFTHLGFTCGRCGWQSKPLPLIFRSLRWSYYIRCLWFFSITLHSHPISQHLFHCCCLSHGNRRGCELLPSPCYELRIAQPLTLGSIRCEMFHNRCCWKRCMPSTMHILCEENDDEPADLWKCCSNFQTTPSYHMIISTLNSCVNIHWDSAATLAW